MDTTILKTSHLTKKYANQSVVNDIDLHVKKGRIYGLLGRNGAGKTTIMKMILGLISITDGSIDVFGLPLATNKEDIYPRIGSIIEIPGFYANLTGTENLRVFATLRGVTRKHAIENALRIVGLPFADKKPFSSYSLGMKQRLGIANAILNDPEILILDEPTNGLDPIGIAEIRNFLKDLCHEEGKTIIISSHILSEIALIADDIGIIHNGVLLEECPLEELQNKSKRYISIQTTDLCKTIHVLENIIGIKEYSVEDNNFIRIYELERNISEIARIFISENIALTHLELTTDDLEDYFKRITGGVGIG